MGHKAIEQYLTDILIKQMEAFGVSEAFTERIINTVRNQITSCVYHWNDTEFRKALLLIGSEEGIQYKPYADDDIRNFVVIAIRNSEIETIQSKNYAEAGLSDSIDSMGVKKITSAAIEYFKGVDFHDTQSQIEQSVSDIYADVARKYPIAWSAVSQLANSESQIVEYGKKSRLLPVSIDKLPSEQEIQTLFRGTSQAGIGVSVVSDGISFSIDRHLKEMLAHCVIEEMPFFIPSFKFLTRNIEKLLLIMEYLLSSDVPFVTLNYYMTNGYTERRLKLIKAGRSYADAVNELHKTACLGDRHRVVLNSIAKALQETV